MPDEEGGFTLLGSRRAGQGRLVSLDRCYYRVRHHGLAVRDLVRHPGSVAVVPLIEGDVVLIRQHRTAVGRALLEIPAGLRDHPDEPPEVTAARECEEEIGYRPARLTLLRRFYTSPGFTDEELLLYLAEELTEAAVRPQGAEEQGAQVVRLPLAEAMRMVAEGEIVDAKTLVGLAALEEGMHG